MLWRHLQSSADMPCDKFPGILACRTVGVLVLALMQEQVVAYAAAYEALLYSRQGVYCAIEFQQLCVVGIEVGTYLRVYARWTFAFLASLFVASGPTTSPKKRILKFFIYKRFLCLYL